MKKILALMLALTFLTSCGNTASKEINIDSLAETMVSSLDFEDELMAIDSEMAFYIHDVEELVNDAVVYLGSGATAEEVAVFEAKNKNAMKELKEEIAEYIEDKRDEYEDYIPAEVSRINKAVIREEGNYLVLCINNDAESVKTLLEIYFNKEK